MLLIPRSLSCPFLTHPLLGLFGLKDFVRLLMYDMTIDLLNWTHNTMTGERTLQVMYIDLYLPLRGIKRKMHVWQ